MKRPLLTLAIWLVGGCAAILAGLYALGAAIETGAIQPASPVPAATSRAALEASPEQPLPTLDPWPFKSDTAVLRCRDGVFRTAEIDGREYALNGIAQSSDRFRNVDEVWLANPAVPGTRVFMSATEKAGTLCETPDASLEVRKLLHTSNP